MCSLSQVYLFNMKCIYFIKVPMSLLSEVNSKQIEHQISPAGKKTPCQSEIVASHGWKSCPVFK